MLISSFNNLILIYRLIITPLCTLTDKCNSITNYKARIIREPEKESVVENTHLHNATSFWIESSGPFDLRDIFCPSFQNCGADIKSKSDTVVAFDDILHIT